MRITLRNKFKNKLSKTLDLGADRGRRVVFIDHWVAMTVFKELFDDTSYFCLNGIEAKDEDGDRYLVLLR